MEIHRRWFCKECKRERVRPTACFANSAPLTITGNPDNGRNCVVCGSPEIVLIEYKPYLPGLDIPRDDPEAWHEVPVEIASTIPGLTSTSEYNQVIEKVIEVEQNAQELIATPLTLPEAREERGSIYDLSDMD